MILNENAQEPQLTPPTSEARKSAGLHIDEANVWVRTYITRQNSDPNDSHNINFRFGNVPQKGVGCH